jgi:hypothetical protein
MSRAGHQREQAVGGGFGAPRLAARLDRVDVEVQRAGMIRILGDDALEGGDDLLGARLWRPIGRPEVPGPQVHHRIGEEGGDLEVVRELPGGLAHRVGVGAVELGALGRGIGRVALGDGLDHGPLRRLDIRRAAHGLLRGGRGLLFAVGVGGMVVVGALGDGDPPEAHRAGRVQTRGFPESPLRLEMVERVREA